MYKKNILPLSIILSASILTFPIFSTSNAQELKIEEVEKIEEADKKKEELKKKQTNNTVEANPEETESKKEEADKKKEELKKKQTNNTVEANPEETQKKEPISEKEIEKVEETKEALSEKITKINVIAHLYPVETNKTAPLVEEISAEELKTVWGPANNTLSALQSIPGINVIQNGGVYGQVASLFLRGGNASDVLLLVDGIEIKDPSSPTRNLDFSFIDFNNVERIEVLKGPSSSIYGSNAMTGVIHIITKKDKAQDGIHSVTTTGSYHTISTQKTLIKTFPKVRYQASSRITSTKGISAVREDSPEPERIDDDGYSERSISFQAQRKLNKRFRTDVVLKYKERELEYDDYSMTLQQPIEDPNAEATIAYFAGKAEITADLIPKVLKSSFSFEHSLWNRKYRLNPTEEDFYRGHIQKFSMLNHINTSLFSKSTLGIEYEKETMHSTLISGETTDSLGAFIEQYLDLDPFFGSAALRYSHNSKTNDSLGYRLSFGMNIENSNTTVRAGYGKAIKRPSLFQLFSPQYGNATLEKENLKGFDIGVEHFWKKGPFVKAGYFRYDAKNQIVFEDNRRYENIKESELSGIETSTTYTFIKNKLDLSASYSYLFNANDKTTNTRFSYRPKHTMNGALHFYPYKSTKLNLLMDHVGTRYTNATNTDALPSYVLFHVTGNVQVRENSTLFFQVNNILNKEYEIIKDYNTPKTHFLITWSTEL